MLSLSDDSESKVQQGADDFGLRRVDGKLGHHTAIRASATKASRTGASVFRTSAPKLST